MTDSFTKVDNQENLTQWVLEIIWFIEHSDQENKRESLEYQSKCCQQYEWCIQFFLTEIKCFCVGSCKDISSMNDADIFLNQNTRTCYHLLEIYQRKASICLSVHDIQHKKTQRLWI